ncbi:MAG TPA: YcxB family protein [Patescibacteria group bacterium]|nr:YcxB family protein [Patescibacteria group bacterium]
MQLAGKLNEQDVAEAQALVRTKGDRATIVSWVLRIAAVVGLMAFVTFRFLTAPTHPNLAPLGVLWLFVLGLGGIGVYLYKSREARVMARLRLPDWIDLSDDGVKMSKADGASSFCPWVEVKSWREGRRVIVLMQSKAHVLTILPVSDLSDAARQPLRDLLKAHVVASPDVP